ncbi:type IX secretion system protein PorG [Polluticaenibacter yanchengensis]|uniref:DUF6089 family protein n=1 Tax=Polluticaenibacter yanchengensis TaxID=3014562 RepID=A0ABT4ULP1_9BACT|nr:DUF6089 family protein [Chitinophagaceae bacterium LY-5]
MLKKLFFVCITSICAVTSVSAQINYSTVLNGEFGIGVGAAHYFGDLNNTMTVDRPKMAASIFFRKNFGNYIALRAEGTFAQLGYSDIHSKNEFQQIRNLSFNANIFEFSVAGDFNFFRFIPGTKDYNFTPYVTLGLGAMSYNPYAYLNNEKYFLRDLGTEGQNSDLYPDRKPYGSMAMTIPFGVGIKYNVTPGMNVFFELKHRFTSTDYLDDVSLTYAGEDAFPLLPNGEFSPAFLLQDRSYEVKGANVGVAGMQRGISKAKDMFITAQIGVTFNITSYRCPTP